MKYFGTDGIRGTVGVFPIVPDFIFKLGYAAGVTLGHIAHNPSVVVGRDTRYSGPALQSVLSAGLLASGVTVFDAGVIMTPGVAYLTRKLGLTAGIIISASHNPAPQNGIKFFDQNGFKLPAPLEQEIEERVEAITSFEKLNWATLQSGRCVDGSGMRELYITDLVNEHPGLCLEHLNIVLDCANGAASALAPECFSRLGANIHVVNATPTGTNINHDAGSEYVRQNPESMISLMHLYNAAFGIAFDGDADRVVFVDPKLGVLDGDYMLAMLAQYLNRQNKLVNRTIVTTTMRNAGLAEFAKASGLNLIETKVGDKYVVEELVAMTQNADDTGGLALGGEQAGHIILLDSQHATGDGIRTALFMVKVLVESHKSSFVEFADCIRKTPQIIASAPVSGKPAIENSEEIKMILRQVEQRLPGLLRLNVRYSGTEPLFRVMLEADTRHSEEELVDEALKICHAVQKEAGKGIGPIEILNCARGGISKHT